MVSDLDKKMYSDIFGFQSGSFFTIFGLSSISYYVRAAFSGRTLPVGSPGADIYQLGGNVIMEGGNEDGELKGNILYTYGSKNPADRPSIEDLLKELEIK